MNTRKKPSTLSEFETICNQLNRISQSLQLSKWQYSDGQDTAYIDIQERDSLPHLNKLRAYLKNKNVNCRYATNPNTGKLQLYVIQPVEEQLKKIPVYESDTPKPVYSLDTQRDEFPEFQRQRRTETSRLFSKPDAYIKVKQREAICELLNGISRSLRLPKWKYGDKDFVYIGILGMRDDLVEDLNKLKDHLAINKLSLSIETSGSSVFLKVPHPDFKQIKGIPVCEPNQMILSHSSHR